MAVWRLRRRRLARQLASAQAPARQVQALADHVAQVQRGGPVREPGVVNEVQPVAARPTVVVDWKIRTVLLGTRLTVRPPPAVPPGARTIETNLYMRGSARCSVPHGTRRPVPSFGADLGSTGRPFRDSS
jgi:hypothetical protein